MMVATLLRIGNNNKMISLFSIPNLIKQLCALIMLFVMIIKAPIVLGPNWWPSTKSKVATIAVQVTVPERMATIEERLATIDSRLKIVEAKEVDRRLSNIEAKQNAFFAMLSPIVIFFVMHLLEMWGIVPRKFNSGKRQKSKRASSGG